MEKKTWIKSRKLRKTDGTIAFSWDDKLHNWDGPALIPEGNKKKSKYFLYGIEYNEAQWKEFKSQRTGLPFYKNQSMKNKLDNYRN